MEINVIDKKIDELFDKLEKNIKELDKENLKKHLKNLQNTEKEYNNKAKLLDLEMKSYKEKIIQLKSESFQHIEDIMSETTKIIDSYVKTVVELLMKF